MLRQFDIFKDAFRYLQYYTSVKSLCDIFFVDTFSIPFGSICSLIRSFALCDVSLCRISHTKFRQVFCFFVGFSIIDTQVCFGSYRRLFIYSHLLCFCSDFFFHPKEMESQSFHAFHMEYVIMRCRTVLFIFYSRVYF